MNEINKIFPNYDKKKNDKLIDEYIVKSNKYLKKLSTSDLEILKIWSGDSSNITIPLRKGKANKTDMKEFLNTVEDLYPELNNWEQSNMENLFIKYFPKYCNDLQKIIKNAPKLNQEIYLWKGIQGGEWLSKDIRTCNTSSVNDVMMIVQAFNSVSTNLKSASAFTYGDDCCVELIKISKKVPFFYLEPITQLQEYEVLLPIGGQFIYKCYAQESIEDNKFLFTSFDEGVIKKVKINTNKINKKVYITFN